MCLTRVAFTVSLSASFTRLTVRTTNLSVKALPSRLCWYSVTLILASNESGSELHVHSHCSKHLHWITCTWPYFHFGSIKYKTPKNPLYCIIAHDSVRGPCVNPKLHWFTLNFQIRTTLEYSSLSLLHCTSLCGLHRHYHLHQCTSPWTSIPPGGI